MTQDATIAQTTPSQPGISRLAYHCVGSLVAQMSTPPASVSIKPPKADDDPAPYSVVNFPAFWFGQNAHARELWIGGLGYLSALRINGLEKCGASDNTVKRAAVFIQYQDA